ncbi:MAG: hypothetical protein WKG00_14750 [Polyangiaceae bacterium]
MRAHITSLLVLAAALGGCASSLPGPLSARSEPEPSEEWSVLGDAAAPEAPADESAGRATPQTAAGAGDYEVSFAETAPPPKATPTPRHGFAAPPISRKNGRVVSLQK